MTSQSGAVACSLALKVSCSAVQRTALPGKVCGIGEQLFVEATMPRHQTHKERRPVSFGVGGVFFLAHVAYLSLLVCYADAHDLVQPVHAERSENGSDTSAGHLQAEQAGRQEVQVRGHHDDQSALQYDRKIVVPAFVIQDQLHVVSMPPASIVLILTEEDQCHQLHPRELLDFVYKPNASMNDCDKKTMWTWFDIFPLVPLTYRFWNAVGHWYFFKFPSREYLSRKNQNAFCFIMEDRYTRKTVTFVMSVDFSGQPRTELHTLTAVCVAILTFFSMT
ncbi:hypothetical protein CSUI_002404 [Cystoisospora suis]|uniref:Transmembrane protein n=1 Tax=Cystoisospora suis TaxID=483139 RepID=A0A2C6L6I9_9APIC|nr:hypothetical protein CSUI_002404 [Cystoisospora suis]